MPSVYLNPNMLDMVKFHRLKPSAILQESISGRVPSVSSSDLELIGSKMVEGLDYKSITSTLRLDGDYVLEAYRLVLRGYLEKHTPSEAIAHFQMKSNAMGLFREKIPHVFHLLSCFQMNPSALRMKLKVVCCLT